MSLAQSFHCSRLNIHSRQYSFPWKDTDSKHMILRKEWLVIPAVSCCNVLPAYVSKSAFATFIISLIARRTLANVTKERNKEMRAPGNLRVLH